VLIGLEAALQGGDARAAWRLFIRAAAIGALPLGGTDRMLGRLFTVALEDQSLDGAAFRELVKSLGWDRNDLGNPAVADVRERVDRRLAAEAWYDKLNAVADGVAVKTRPEAQAARVLLGRSRGRGLIGISRPTLRQLLDQLRPHQMWLNHRIPASRVATLEQRYRRREIIAAALSAACVGFLLLQGIIVLISASSSGQLQPAGGMILFLFIVFLAWGFWAVVKSLIRRWGDRPV
jgi:PAS domain-containing protein